MAQADGVSSTNEVETLVTSEKASTQHSTALSHDSYTSRSTYNADLLDEFAGMDEDCLLGEAAIVKESKQQDTFVEPPALPQKSSLRASRLLDSLKLSSIESATQSLTTPHDAYMSSEEDASSSADEFSDYDYDSCSEISEGSLARRKSYEDTARVVSVVYSGKPCLVDLPSPRRSVTSSTTDSSSESESSIETPLDSSLSVDFRPPRTSSLIPTGQPSFLKKDPFAESRYALDTAKEDQLDGAVRAVKTLNRVQRTFSLVRKRSRPFLRTSSAAAISREDVTLPSLPVSTINLPQLVAAAPVQTPELESPVELTDSARSPVRYSDILRSARKNASSKSVTTLPSITPISPLVSSKRGILSGLKPSRRRSLRS